MPINFQGLFLHIKPICGTFINTMFASLTRISLQYIGPPFYMINLLTCSCFTTSCRQDIFL